MNIDIREANDRTFLTFADNDSLISFIKDNLKPKLGEQMDKIWCATSPKKPLLVFETRDFKQHIQPLMQ